MYKRRRNFVPGTLGRECQKSECRGRVIDFGRSGDLGSEDLDSVGLFGEVVFAGVIELAVNVGVILVVAPGVEEGSTDF